MWWFRAWGPRIPKPETLNPKLLGVPKGSVPRSNDEDGVRGESDALDDCARDDRRPDDGERHLRRL